MQNNSAEDIESARSFIEEEELEDPDDEVPMEQEEENLTNNSDDASTKSDLASKISQSHEDDAIQEEIERINYQIAQEEKMREKYLNQIDKMTNDIEQMKADGKTIELNVEELDEKRKQYPEPPEQSYYSGDFFHRMNAFDVRDAIVNGVYNGQQNVIKEMNNLIKKQKLANAALQKKYEQLIQQIPGYVDYDMTNDAKSENKSVKSNKSRKNQPENKDMKQMNIQISNIQKSINQQDEEFKKLTRECEDYQQKIRDISLEISTNPESNIELMNDQRQALDEEIKNKQRQLKETEENLKTEQGRSNRSSRTSQVDDRSRISYASDASTERWLERQQLVQESKAKSVKEDDAWMSERDALLQNIQKVKQEIRQYEQKESFSPRKSLSTSSRKSKSYASSILSIRSQENNKGFLRQAMAMELENLQSEDHPINQAIKQESLYAEKLSADILAVEATKKSIEDFSSRLFAKQDEDYDNRKQRIDMLKAELAELRSKVGN